MANMESQSAMSHVEETEAALLRITIAELPAPFSELTTEEFKELHARHLARSAENLSQLDAARTHRSENQALTVNRGLYEELGIRDSAESKPQSRVIGGGHW